MLKSSQSCLSVWIRSWKRSCHPVRCVGSGRLCFKIFVWHSHCGRPQRQPHGGLRSSLHHLNIPQQRRIVKQGITKPPQIKYLSCFVTLLHCHENYPNVELREITMLRWSLCFMVMKCGSVIRSGFKNALVFNLHISQSWLLFNRCPYHRGLKVHQVCLG